MKSFFHFLIIVCFVLQIWSGNSDAKYEFLKILEGETCHQGLWPSPKPGRQRKCLQIDTNNVKWLLFIPQSTIVGRGFQKENNHWRCGKAIQYNVDSVDDIILPDKIIVCNLNFTAGFLHKSLKRVRYIVREELRMKILSAKLMSKLLKTDN